MGKKFLVSLFLGCCVWAQAQDVSRSSFRVPLDIPLYLSGNFGELRPNHFHGGLDFKTQGVEGKPVHSIEEGYISRISVMPGGYGNALYVTHPNGYTSVYGHLKEFASAIAKYVEDEQYAKESFEVNLFPDASLFPVKKGEVIALSGNTGSSGGPHLHLEIRNTEANEPVNPLPFYLSEIKDTKPPRAYSVMFYPQAGKGVVNGSKQKRSIAFVNRSGRTVLAQPVDAWGEIGLGLRAYDYMNETNNTYGVFSVTLYVDSVKVFNSMVDRFLFDENRAINGWTDYDVYKQKRSWYMKSFLPAGNRLRMLHAGDNRGFVRINEERDYHIMYVLEDAHGNVSRYRFTIRGKRRQIPSHVPQGKYLLRWDQANIIQEPGMELAIPKGMLYDDVEADTKIIRDSSAVAFVYQLHNSPVPLHTYCPLAIGIRNFPVADTTKYYIAGKWGNALHYVGGTYENGWMKASIRELATYTVAIDTVPPKVEPLNKGMWERSKEIAFRLSDKHTGIRSYKGMIDGKFVLFTYNLRRRLACKLAKARIERGKRHTLELEVTDFCGNVTRVKEEFYY